MPLVFIFSGLFFYLIIFNIIFLKNKKKRYLLLIVFFLICLSYFIGDIKFQNFSFNILSLSSLLILFLLINHQLYGFNDVILIVLSSLFYKILLDKDINFLLNFDNRIAIFLIVIFALYYINNIYLGLRFVITTVYIFCWLNFIEGYSNFGYAVIDYNFAYFVCLIYISLFVIIRVCYQFLKNKQGGLVFEKIFNIDSSIHMSNLWLKY